MLNRVNLNLSTRRCKFILLECIHTPQFSYTSRVVGYMVLLLTYFDMLSIQYVLHVCQLWLLGITHWLLARSAVVCRLPGKGQKCGKQSASAKTSTIALKSLCAISSSDTTYIHVYHRKWMKQYRATTVNAIVQQYNFCKGRAAKEVQLCHQPK